MTHVLNKLARVLEIDEVLQEQQENTLIVMNRLESAYPPKNDEGLAEKSSDKADDLVEQIDRETTCAHSLLASLVKVKSRPSSVAGSETSQRRNEKEKAEMEA